MSLQGTQVSSRRTFEIQFRCTEAEYMSAHWTYFQHHPWQVFIQFRFPVVVVFVSAIAFFEYPNQWQRLGLVTLLAAAMLVFALLIYRRNWHQRFTKSAFGWDIVSATFNQQSVGFRLDGREVLKPWREIRDIYESRRVFVFEWAKSGLVFLPKSGMTQSHLDELRSLISAHKR
jgi:hypothetical protein